MKIIIIAAIADNLVIGNNNSMIWKLPEDIKRFKKITMGNYVIMGRKTFESIKKPLIGRKNIVITRNNNYIFNGVKVSQSLDETIFYLKKKNTKKVFIIGGGQIYNQSINIAHTLEITIIHNKFQGDTKFPIILPEVWKKTREVCFVKNKNSIYNYSFITYKRS